MRNPEQLLSITCDFTPPEVSLEAFRSHKTDETLAKLLHEDPLANALKEAYENPDLLSLDELSQLEREAIRSGAESLRTCMQYSYGTKPWEEKPKGDCYAYTWLMSDITEGMGMKSLIAYCNGHAFNIIQGRSGELHMINGESKHMWLYDLENNSAAKDSFSNDVLEQIKHIDEESPVICSLRTDSLRYYSDNSQDYSKRVTLPWLQDEFPAAKIMVASEGKKALFAYTCFEQAVQRGDISELLTALSGMSSCNPQVETRERMNLELRDVKKLIKHWAARTDIPAEDMVRVVDLYRSVMPETKSMTVFVGDCMRIIGQERQDRSSLEAAGSMYDIAERRYTRKKDRTLEGKIRKLNKIFSQQEPELIGAST